MQKRPYPLHTLLVRAKSRVARCVRLRRPGRRLLETGGGNLATGNDPGRVPSRNSFEESGPEVCETGAVSSARPRPPGHRRRRTDRGRKVRSGRLPRPASRRRGRQRRLHAALPRDGHRHRQADARGARRRPAPPPGHLGRHRSRRASPSTRGWPAPRSTALLAEGRWPILVGGSGLYVRGAVDDLEFPGTDPEVRARLEEELALRGSGALHARLAAADPEAAQAILPSNGRRIVRALEVIEITGKPFTANLPGHDSVYDTVQIGVDVARPELDERIARRVDRMWEAGLVDEVRALEARGLREGRTASRALGYQQVLAALAGECTEEEARAETVRATKRFARRQDSWFRRDPRVHWLSGAAADRAELPHRALALVERPVTA